MPHVPQQIQYMEYWAPEPVAGHPFFYDVPKVSFYRQSQKQSDFNTDS